MGYPFSGFDMVILEEKVLNGRVVGYWVRKQRSSIWKYRGIVNITWRQHLRKGQNCQMACREILATQPWYYTLHVHQDTQSNSDLKSNFMVFKEVQNVFCKGS